jgi:methanol metabolism-related c-type cytochrome
VKVTSPARRLPVVVFFLALSSMAMADGSGDPDAVKIENGRYYDIQGDPTFSVRPDGTVDWPTYSGFRHYESECQVCHGLEGDGSGDAPALKDALKTLSYSDVYGIVAGAKPEKKVRRNMPHAFSDNKNVMCYLNDIYVYLRARANDAVPDGRPQKREDKPSETAAEEEACLATGKS